MDEIVNRPDYLADNTQQGAPGESVRLWHPLLNFTRTIRHTLGLRSVRATDKQKVLLRNCLRSCSQAVLASRFEKPLSKEGSMSAPPCSTPARRKRYDRRRAAS